MITEDYVSFETAKLLKENGYCNISNTLYKETGEFICYEVGLNNKGFSTILGNFYEAPTLQMAMKWLREIYYLEIYPYHDFPKVGDKWWFEIIKYPNSVSEYESETAYNSYEEACETAIQYCLENLI